MKAPLVLPQILQGCQILFANVTLEKPESLMNRLDVELHGQLLGEELLAELALEVFQIEVNLAHVRPEMNLLRELDVALVALEVLDAEVNAADVVLEDVAPTERDVTTVALKPLLAVDDPDVTRATRLGGERRAADLAHHAADAGVAEVTLKPGLEVELPLAAVALKVAADGLRPAVAVGLRCVALHVWVEVPLYLSL